MIEKKLRIDTPGIFEWIKRSGGTHEVGAAVIDGKEETDDKEEADHWNADESRSDERNSTLAGGLRGKYPLHHILIDTERGGRYKG